MFLFFIFFLICCIARLLFIQFFRSSYLTGIARKQHNLFVELEPRRGTIFDCNLKPQAVNITLDSLYASPAEIRDNQKENIIRQLSPILNKSQDYLRDRLYRKKSFIWIARKITPEQSQAIKKLDIKGLGFLKESKRTYPNGYLASHVIGFAGLDNTGLEGLEAGYDKYLKGEAGWALFLRDARQKKLELWEEMLVPKDGYNLILTIDEVIQYIAERELDKAFKIYHAKGASIVVMDPHTGAILALANRPTFDLDEHTGIDKDAMRNRAICDLFEPGSVFKIVTASAALEEKRVSEEDKFFCENGSYKIASRILRDHTSHGWLTFREVMEESSNIGIVKIAEKIGRKRLYDYIKVYGFGEKTGVDMIETTGHVKSPSSWTARSMGSIPFGQEISVTAIQMLSAVNAIANDGIMMKPFVVKRITNGDETVAEYSPLAYRKPISSKTAKMMKQILVGAVEDGTGKKAKIVRYSVAGKTGTSQKASEDKKGYIPGKYVSSFVGFLPADNPIISMIVIIDEPQDEYFGGTVACPVFRNIADQIMQYFTVGQGICVAQVKPTS